MESTTKTSSLLLASLLCVLLLSQVGILMAQPEAKAPAPGTQVGDECPKKCAYRCSKSWKPKMCNKTCVACCHRCPDHCVPNGPRAPRDSCYCYSQIKTHNKFKCP
ncbi:putative GAST1 protein [Hibiscus syriacus]|uniref:GAST1 protein n=1 Tax=Hibiscus syriacus TaxID=106335 RepID=A0A6A2Z1L4_HIBSY|nr:peamaclein-like [Hibiscus syriacus]KAE8685666.1 putative GAST1 protein [Hibiscus syriacus]